MNYNTMQYIPTPRNHWLEFGLKFAGMVGTAALVATLATGWVKNTGAPAQNAPVAQQVQYYSKGVGRLGQNAHWTTQASENTQAWQKAKAYCQAQSAGQGQGSAGQSGCGTIDELANSGY